MIHVTISINFGRPPTANSDSSDDSDNDDEQKSALQSIDLQDDPAMAGVLAEMDADSDGDGTSEHPPASPKDKAACPCHVAFLVHVCSFAVVILLCMYVAEFTTKLN